MKYAKFEKVAYAFVPSPHDADSFALAFIRLHRDWLRIDVNEFYYRVRFSEFVSKDDESTVYVADCRYLSQRSGHVFSCTSPASLLQELCDYVGLIK